ncbi:MAG: phosphoribosylanthranilate isomerase [Candidatus Omnitrophota bacterium]
MVRVKVCGITNLRDAVTAVEAGADALGFVFAPSPRRVTPARARKIIRAVGPWVASVGVFVNEKVEKVRRVALFCGLSAVQLHGDESAPYAKKLSPLKVIKAFRVSKPGDLRGIEAYDADAYLFDTKVEGLYGGTGKRFDWRILKRRKLTKPVILSGGLNPKNVRQAVRERRPYGVDVSSGVERSPGKKDARLVREFIRRAKTN